jgi:2-polyprenyl-3-methyl-5-hydroxy-6-metoxy-1,4-benzoquinol methylase
MPVLSNLARQKKLAFFIDPIPKNAKVLEAGCGGNWVKEYMLANGWKQYTGVDVEGDPDIKGDLKDWKALGLQQAAYDVIIAFEVVEHDDLWQAFYDLLKPGGRLLLTTPVPSGDWILKLLEAAGLNQKRTSPHNQLIDVRTVKLFETVTYKSPLGLSQWVILRKPKPLVNQQERK